MVVQMRSRIVFVLGHLGLIALMGCGDAEGACDLWDPSVSARFCYDDKTEADCEDLATRLGDEWSHYPGDSCADRGCPGGGPC